MVYNIFNKTPYITTDIVNMRNLSQKILDTFQEAAKELNKDFSELLYFAGGEKLIYQKNLTFD